MIELAAADGRFETVSGTKPDSLEQRFTALLAREGPALARVASSYVRSPGDRDDLLQEIAMALWQALPVFRGDCSERTFLFRIAHNRAIAYLAKNRRQGEARQSELERVDPSPDAEALLLEHEGEHRLANAVRALPVLYREPMVLLLEGLEYGEIAAILGISESNVGARLSRARQLLRQKMGVRK